MEKTQTETNGKATEAAPVVNGAAEARKRRKEIIQSQRNELEGVAAAKAADQQANDASDPPSKSEKPPKKRKLDSSKANGDSDKKRTQVRYDPDTPMDKEQLAAWRREARRVRNRESAAASRQRIRNRINELEDEVGQWKSKYSQAMQRLAALEQSIQGDAKSTE